MTECKFSYKTYTDRFLGHKVFCFFTNDTHTQIHTTLMPLHHASLNKSHHAYSSNKPKNIKFFGHLRAAERSCEQNIDNITS